MIPTLPPPLRSRLKKPPRPPPPAPPPAPPPSGKQAAPPGSSTDGSTSSDEDANTSVLTLKPALLYTTVEGDEDEADTIVTFKARSRKRTGR